ncbi:hypothetical protein [Sphingomonas sp. VNH70]|uniref:hypothetical protein n=1 Tax=Sphingomonas silueang TaxID=3156617 RepID=UPI0032B54039
MKLMFAVLAMAAATAPAGPERTYADCCAECRQIKATNLQSCQGKVGSALATCQAKWAESEAHCLQRCLATETAKTRRNEQRSREAVDRALNPRR